MEVLVPEGLEESHRQHRDEYMEDPVRRPMGVGLELQEEIRSASEQVRKIIRGVRPGGRRLLGRDTSGRPAAGGRDATGALVNPYQSGGGNHGERGPEAAPDGGAR